MAEIKSVLILGATGNLGPSILTALLDAGTFDVSVVTRTTSTATFPSSVTVHKSDYSDASLLAAFKGQDAVVSVLGSPSLSDQTRIIDLAAQAGVKRFLPSEFGSNLANEKTLKRVPIFAAKVAVREHLKTKEKEGLTWTGICTGPFFDWGLQVGFLGYQLKTHTATIYDSGDQPFTTTTLPTIGAAVAGVLSHPAETVNKIIFVQSVTTTQNKILAALEKATGASWTVQKASVEETVKTCTEKLQKGDYSGIGGLIISAVFSAGYGQNYPEDATVDNKLIGLPEEEDLETVVKKVVG